jgi:hypothetical protein
MKYYSLPWTRLRTIVAGVMSDVLVAIGGYGLTMGAIRQQNKKLFGALQTTFPARRTGRDGAA